MAANTGTRPTFTPPKTYSYRQLEELWIAAGGRRIAAPTAAAIALAESSGDPNSVGHNANGSVDRGLWQINSVHGSLSTTNVLANAKAAVKIYNESGWSPWTTFKTGAYQKHFSSGGVSLEPGAEPKGLFQQSLEAGGSLLEASGFGAAANAGAKAVGGKTGTEEGAAAIRSGEASIEKPLEKLGPPKWLNLLLTGVLLLAGAALVVYGIMVAVRPRESGFSLPRMPVPVPV